MSKKLNNNFLAVEDYLFKLQLNPTEILTLAKIIEFNRNSGDCFISDDKLATDFGVSTKTISRTMKTLEDRGFIIRDTKNKKGGKERHIKVNHSKINEVLSKDNLPLENEDDEMPQETNCLLSKDKMSIVKGQNDVIKDNIIENKKDNLEEIEVPSISSNDEPEERIESKPEVKEDGSIENPYIVSKEWLVERYNNLYPLKNGLFRYNNKFYKMVA